MQSYPYPLCVCALCKEHIKNKNATYRLQDPGTGSAHSSSFIYSFLIIHSFTQSFVHSFALLLYVCAAAAALLPNDFEQLSGMTGLQDIFENAYEYWDFCPRPGCGRPFTSPHVDMCSCGEPRYGPDGKPRAQTAYLRPEVLAGWIVVDDGVYEGAIESHTSAGWARPWGVKAMLEVGCAHAVTSTPSASAYASASASASAAPCRFYVLALTTNKHRCCRPGAARRSG